MDTSFNCYVLILSSDDSETISVDIYKNNKNRRYFQRDNKTQITLANFKVSHLKEHICNIYGIKKVDQRKVKLWKVNVEAEKIKNNNISTGDDITHKLEGRKMEEHELFNAYFKVELADHSKIEMGNIHIIAIIPTIVVPATDLERKRPITEEEETTELKRSKWDTRKWDTNGAIRKVQRAGVYFVDPLTLSEPLLDKIREGEFVALYGARATGKTTRVFRVMEQLEEEGYICIYISLETINKDDEKEFWSSLGDYIFDNHNIKSSSDFAKLFLKSQKKWEKDVILFIDEYDIMYKADEALSSFLKVVRGIKASKERFAIWSINVIGTFSILHLSSKDVTTSPFNIKEPFQNPNFTREQVQFLFDEYANDEKIIIDQEVVENIYMRTSGHPGLVTNCGKAIHERLKQEFGKKLDISIWLKFTASNRLEGAIRNYETFRKMIERFVEEEEYRPAVNLLRSSFAGFLGSIKINDSDEERQANCLTAEGVLTVVNKDDRIYRMSSAFIDELVRRRVISDIYKSCPESTIPVKDDESLDTLKILQTAVQFFDKTIISNGFTRSFKIADELCVGGKKKKKVPRESVYDTELSRILVNWLVKKGGYIVTGQWHIVEKHDSEKDKHSYSDIVITTDRQKIVLELLATATKKELDEHFERVLKYAELLSADEIWIVHFTCEDNYAQKLQWPSSDRINVDRINVDRINVVHFLHDQMLNVKMNARYTADNGTIEHITDQAIPLLY